MKLSQEDMALLLEICKGLSPDEARRVAIAYYKTKLAKSAPKINKSYSYKPVNTLSQFKSVREMIGNITKGG